MRRADRLFQIIQIMRSDGSKPVTAHMLAEELETSVRTIYRDIADLMSQRVPIRGEAGVGYVLERGYDMPPLMLTANEIEAAVMGAQWVASNGDKFLRQGARDLISKITDVIPLDLRPVAMKPTAFLLGPSEQKEDAIDMQQLRLSIRKQGKLKIKYLDLKGSETTRIIWPIVVGYFKTVRLIVAWCEKRSDFRHFRSDKIQDVIFLDETYPTPTKVLRDRWYKAEMDKNYPDEE
jgi:predicted DNA-binding transcriptional regulator YafY